MVLDSSSSSTLMIDVDPKQNRSPEATLLTVNGCNRRWGEEVSAWTGSTLKVRGQRQTTQLRKERGRWWEQEGNAPTHPQTGARAHTRPFGVK